MNKVTVECKECGTQFSVNKEDLTKMEEPKKLFTVEEIMAALMQQPKEAQQIVERDEAWAPNSQFYNKVMADGYIFNPYLHRRFLPAQFLLLMKNYDMNVHRAIAESYGFMYSIKWTIDEIGKLAYLQKVDKVAFAERQKFLTLDDVKVIMSHYVESMIKYLDECVKYGRWICYNGRHIPTRTWGSDQETQEVTNLKNDLLAFGNNVYSAVSYEKMNHVLCAFNLLKLKYEAEKSKAFVDAFEKSGAYYTLKHLILFEGLSLKGKSGADAAKELNEYMSQPAYVVYAILKEVIEENQYEI